MRSGSSYNRPLHSSLALGLNYGPKAGTDHELLQLFRFAANVHSRESEMVTSLGNGFGEHRKSCPWRRQISRLVVQRKDLLELLGVKTEICM
jgi:hypothetical protein